MKEIDLSTWSRRPHYEFFRTFQMPFFDVAARVDLTEMVEFVRREDKSLFATMLQRVTKAATATQNLRYRFRGERVFEVEQCQPSFTVLGDDETFNYATALYDDDLDVFTERVRQAAEENRNRPDINLSEDHRLELIYVTCMPWLDFQAITHPIIGDENDCAPRIAWGKIVETDQGRWETTLQVTAHHSLVDGLQVARFFEAFEKVKTPESSD